MALRIYVHGRCWGCATARDLATQIGRIYPKLSVELIDLSDAEAEKPGEVFATPTYMLNGRIVSLGNPKLETRRAGISEETREEEKCVSGLRD